MRHSSQKTIKKILVVNVNWVGDVIFSSPVFKALKESYPQASISCMAVPRVKEVLEAVPFIDEIIVYDEKGRHWDLLGKLKLIFELRRKHFDAAFLLHGSWTRALLIYLAAIPDRIGYDTKNRGKLLTHKVEPLEGPTHRSDYYLNVIESYGVRVNDRRCQLKTSVEAERKMEELLRSRGIEKKDYKIVVNPGGNWDLKKWPKENFARLISGFMGSFSVKVVVSGAQKDISLGREINSFSFHSAVNLTGETDLKQLVALMKVSDLVIPGDTGPLHIASSVGTEVIGLFGPTRPEVTGPRGSGRVHIFQHDVGCNLEPCYHLACPDNICMQSITAAEVLEIVEKIKNR
jgi:heptosyltransferase II